MSSLLLCYIFCTAFMVIPCQSFNMLGPANIIYKSFEYCETKVTDFDVWLTQRKFNRTTNVLDIKLGTPWPCDEDLILEVTAEVKKEGGYKPGSFYMKDNICKVLSTMLGDVFAEFLRIAGTDDCPIPAGTYEIKDFYLDNDKLTIPQIYGEYRIGVKILKDEEVKGCYFVFADMVPKD